MIIETRYLSPTEHRGSRIKAVVLGDHVKPARSVTLPYSHSLGQTANHVLAAATLLANIQNSYNEVDQQDTDWQLITRPAGWHDRGCYFHAEPRYNLPLTPGYAACQDPEIAVL